MSTQKTSRARSARWWLAVISLTLSALACGIPTTTPATPVPPSPTPIPPVPEGVAWPGDETNPVTLTVINGLSTAICYLYISPPDDVTWGGDWLGADEAIDPGASRPIEVPAGRYDLLAVSCNKDTLGDERQFDLTVARQHTFEPRPGVTARACESPATPIEVGVAYPGHLDATDQPYPANCTYYCLWIPQGAGTLEIALSGFEVDLDLYVGYGDLSSIMGADSDQSDWKSNEFGTDDEAVTILSPAADSAYYLEICSYQSLASDFRLEATVR